MVHYERSHPRPCFSSNLRRPLSQLGEPDSSRLGPHFKGRESNGCEGFCRAAGSSASLEHGAGRSAALKLLGGETAESVMMFEEGAPSGTVTPMHLHYDSDEVTYVLSGEFTFKIGEEVTVGGPSLGVGRQASRAGSCRECRGKARSPWRLTGTRIPGNRLWRPRRSSAGNARRCHCSPERGARSGRRRCD